MNYLQDALSSPPAALAVRVPPQSPRILFNGSHVMPGQNITVPAGNRATVVCEARYGNPPAYIEWYLGKKRDKNNLFLRFTWYGAEVRCDHYTVVTIKSVSI